MANRYPGFLFLKIPRIEFGWEPDFTSGLYKGVKLKSQGIGFIALCASQKMAFERKPPNPSHCEEERRSNLMPPNRLPRLFGARNDSLIKYKTRIK